MMKTKKLINAAVSLILVLCLTIQGSTTVHAEEEDNGKSVYDSVISMGELAPAAYNSAASDDPYGYGVDVPFYMVAENELLVMRTNDLSDSGSGIFHSYENLGEAADQELDYSWTRYELLVAARETGTYELPDSTYLALNYVKAVAFDPTGSGKDDHIALIGIHYFSDERKTLYLIVYDADGNNSGYVELGTLNWMENDELFNAMNNLSITAGDYDGDGEDTLVVFGAFDYVSETDTMGLYEIKVYSHDGAITMQKLNSKPDHTMLALNGETGSYDSFATEYGNIYTTSAIVKTGDFNGDRIDDLAVCCFKGRIETSNDYNKGFSERVPYISVSMGSKGNGSSIVSAVTYQAEVYQSNEDEEDFWDTLVAPGLSVGDMDGDGKDDIVIAGIYDYMTYDTSSHHMGARYKIKDNLKADKFLVGVYGVAKGNIVVKALNKVDSNEYTSDGFYKDDYSYAQQAVQCAAFDGKGNPETLFINGNIYNLKNGTVKRIDADEENCNNKYFQEADNVLGTKGADLSNTFFWDVCAGNFDGDPEGKEEIVFVTALKTKNKEEYHFVLGMVSGYLDAHFDENNNIVWDELVSYYDFTGYKILDEEYWPTSGSPKAHLDDNRGLNFAVCAVDNDNDGLICRYKGKGYVYSDPEVMAVLQAAPYFEELQDYLVDTNDTTYSVSQSFTYEKSTSNSVSYGIAVCGSLDTGAAEIEAEAGYAMDWTETFTNSLTTSTTYSWSANFEDSVVVYRTPIMLYQYEVMKEGDWDENNALVLSVPGTASYQVIPVDDYNSFVDYYNAELDQRAQASDENIEVRHLDKVIDPYLQHEGDPFSYRHSVEAGVTLLQSTPQAFNVGSSSTGFDWSQESSYSESEEMAHGFTFDLTIKFGFEVFGMGAKAGVHESLQYMHGHSTTTTQATGKGVSCTVFNLETKALRDAGIDLDAIRSYTFSYQVATWDSTIRSDDPDGQEMVPTFGYVLSNVRGGIPVVNDLEAAYSEDRSSIVLTWSDPSDEDRPVTSFVVYLIGHDGDPVRLAEVTADVTTYEFTDFDDRLEYDFIVKSKYSGTESLPSNMAYVYKDMKSIQCIKLTKQGVEENTYTIYFTDGTSYEFKIKNGTSITGITLDSISSDGLIVTYKITMSDGQTTTFSVTNGKDGKNGVGIKKIEKTGSNGNVDIYTVTLTNGDSYTFTITNGTNGPQGVSVTDTKINKDGDLIVTLSDGSKINAGKVVGDTGVSIVSVKANEAGELVITMSNGQVFNLGIVSGANGKNGYNGTDGADGRNGVDGKDGKDGKDGLDGKDGKDGVGIGDILIDEEGNLIVTLTDGSKLNVGSVQGYGNVSTRSVPWWIYVWNGALTVCAIVSGVSNVSLRRQVRKEEDA